MQSTQIKILTVKIMQGYTIPVNGGRPQWFNEFIGESFEVEECPLVCYKLTPSGLSKLNSLRPGKKIVSAVIHKHCADPVTMT